MTDKLKHLSPNPNPNRVVPVHEIIYQDLDKLLGHKLKRAELMQAVDYVMEHGNDEYYRGIRVGNNLNDQDRAKLMEGK